MPEKLSKEVCIRLDTSNWGDFTRIAYEQYGHGGITKAIQSLVNDFVKKYDGTLPKMDLFFDSKYIPKPDLGEPYQKIIPYLKHLPQDEFKKMQRCIFEYYVIVNELAKVTPKDRPTLLITSDVWKRYT